MLIDCFLFNDEVALLEIRLQLLAPVVDRFVIVFAATTFTGMRKPFGFPHDNPVVMAYRERIDLVLIDKLEGNGAWEKEAFQRNAILRGLANADPDDLVIVSDVDEIPRPSTLVELSEREQDCFPLVLCLDYYNFAFNYKLLHGQQAVWAGPVITPMRALTSPEQLRRLRWVNLLDNSLNVFDAGWHFSFISSGNSVQQKLMSFSHQEVDTQKRASARPVDLIARREGFHCHMHAGSVWAVVTSEDYRCSELATLISRYPDLVVQEQPDAPAGTALRVKLSVERMSRCEQEKMVRNISTLKIAKELLRRLRRKMGY